MTVRDEKTKQFTMVDLTGQRFGMLTVLGPTDERYKGKVIWECRCDCGKIVFRNTHQLNYGVKTNCGCKPASRIRENLTGKRFGMLTVLQATDKRKHHNVLWECRCDCGSRILVETQYLKNGTTQSCRSCQKKNRPTRDITGQRFGILTALYPTEKRDNDLSVIWHCRCDCGNEVEHSCSELQRKSYISCGCLKRAAEEQLKDRTTHVAGTQVEQIRSKKVRCDNTTGVTGVNVFRGKYKAMIHFQGKRYNLGTYRTVEEAAAVRKKAEECLFGEFLEFYDLWKEKADTNPEWGQENPVSVSVSRTETGEFRILMLPRL